MISLKSYVLDRSRLVKYIVTLFDLHLRTEALSNWALAR